MSTMKFGASVEQARAAAKAWGRLGASAEELTKALQAVGKSGISLKRTRQTSIAGRTRIECAETGRIIADTQAGAQ